MNNLESIIDNQGYITPEIAESHGISKYMFYKYVREQHLVKAGHGIYMPSDEWQDELYILHKRCPGAVFSHDEAFYYHELTDREPLIHTLTTYSGYNSHRLTIDGKCKVYTVKKKLVDIGRTLVNDNFGNEIPMYNLERTICDLIRSRNSIESHEFNSVLKSYISRKDKNLNQLMEYAKFFRIHNIIRNYMEVLL